MFKDVMDNLFGSTIGQGIVSSSTMIQQQMNAYNTANMIRQEQAPKSKKLFHGTVEVLQVANGYIVNIGRKEGYEYETYIAETITDVNERIAAAIVAFQLEGK
jgi:hypothetical protein